jgi:hypothetical protein
MLAGIFRLTNSCGDFSLEGAEGLLLDPHMLPIDAQWLMEAMLNI